MFGCQFCVYRDPSAERLERSSRIRRPPPKFDVDDSNWAELQIKVDRTCGESLGIEVRHSNGALRIVLLEADGLLPRWNMEHPGQALRAGDLIIQANRKQGNAKIIAEECRREQPLVLVVRHAPRPQDMLGADMKLVSGTGALQEDLGSSGVRQWNAAEIGITEPDGDGRVTAEAARIRAENTAEAERLQDEAERELAEALRAAQEEETWVAAEAARVRASAAKGAAEAEQAAGAAGEFTFEAEDLKEMRGARTPEFAFEAEQSFEESDAEIRLEQTQSETAIKQEILGHQMVEFEKMARISEQAAAQRRREREA